MDHSLTITQGRLPAEALMVEFVLAGQPGPQAPQNGVEPAIAN
jgi:hypothetical protein